MSSRPARASSPINSTAGALTATPSPTAITLAHCWLAVAPPSPNGCCATLFDVDALSANDVWAVGQLLSSPAASIVLHWDGDEWTNLPLPPYDDRLAAVEAISPDDVWAFSWETSALHWDGSQWTLIPGPGGDFGEVVAVAPNDIWIISTGPCSQSSVCSNIWHWDGSGWDESFSRPCEGTCQNTLHIVGPNDIRASSHSTDFQETGWMARWDGTQWTDITDDTIRAAGGIHAMAGTSANDLWVSADLGFLHWNGAAWTTYPGFGIVVRDMEASSPYDVWAVGGNLILHWDGIQWGRSENPPGQSSVLGVAAIDADEAWAVGGSNRPNHYGMGIAHYSTDCIPECGPGWHVVTSPATSILRGVAAISSNDVWAVGIDYYGSLDQMLIEHWDGTAWSVVHQSQHWHAVQRAQCGSRDLEQRRMGGGCLS